MLGWVDLNLQHGDITNLVICIIIAFVVLLTKIIIDYLYSKNINFPWWIFLIAILVNCLICIGVMYFLWSHPIIINM